MKPASCRRSAAGVLTSALSWHWIFNVNVPVGLLGLALAPFFLTESRDVSLARVQAGRLDRLRAA